jgi:ankyrin repeat protein
MVAASSSYRSEESPDVLRLLVHAGADIDARDRDGQTAAAIAAGEGHHEMLLLLGALGAPDARAHLAAARVDRRLLSRQAVTSGDHGAVAILLAAGADVSDERGWTPLMHAADRGDDRAVADLLTRGAHVNAIARTGDTALHIAATRQAPGVVRRLLAAGADVHARNGAGETAIIMAAKHNAAPAVSRPSPTPSAEEPRAGQGLTALYVVGAAPREVARNNDADKVALLLVAGADPNTRDAAGRTPLMFAAAQERLAMVQVLLARGADVEVRATNGRMAPDLATGKAVKRALRGITSAR